MIKRIKSMRVIRKMVIDHLWTDVAEKILGKHSYIVHPNTIAYETLDGASLYKPNGENVEIHIIMPNGVGRGFITQLKEQLEDLKKMGFTKVVANVDNVKIAHLCRALGMNKLTESDYGIVL